jgi:hypothetical protein
MYRTFLKWFLLALLASQRLGASETADLPLPTDTVTATEKRVKSAFDNLPRGVVQLIRSKDVTLEFIPWAKSQQVRGQPCTAETGGRFRGSFCPNEKRIRIVQCAKPGTESVAEGVDIKDAVNALYHQVGLAYDWALGRASGSLAFRAAHTTDWQMMPAEPAEKYSLLLRDCDTSRQAAFACAVAIHLRLLSPEYADATLLAGDAERRKYFPRVVEHVGSLLARDIGLVSSETGPTVAHVPTGSAVLHVDVPNGAIVEIDGQPTFNRSWSRYRHFRITGLCSEPRAVAVAVFLQNDSCQCIYDYSNCDCGYVPTYCCRTIHLRANDVEYLDMRRRTPPPKPVQPEPPVIVFLPGKYFAPVTDEKPASGPKPVDAKTPPAVTPPAVTPPTVTPPTVTPPTVTPPTVTPPAVTPPTVTPPADKSPNDPEQTSVDTTSDRLTDRSGDPFADDPP